MTREELRAAVVAAETWYFGGASGSEIGLEQDQKHLATLRAFLGSGLTESERETVALPVRRCSCGKCSSGYLVFDEEEHGFLDGESMAKLGCSDLKPGECRVVTLAVLAPIVEGK